MTKPCLKRSLICRLFQKATGRIRDKKVGSQNVFGGLVSYKKLTLAQEKRGKTTAARTMQALVSGVCAPLTHQSLLRAELCSCLLGWQPQHPSVLSQAWPGLRCLCPQEIQFCSKATLHLVHQHQRTTKHITYANKLKKLEGLNPLYSPEPPLCAIALGWKSFPISCDKCNLFCTWYQKSTRL